MNLLDYAYLCNSSYQNHDVLDTTGLDSSKLKFDTFVPYKKYEDNGVYFYTIDSALSPTLYVVIEGTHDVIDVVQDLYVPVPYKLPNGKIGFIQSAWLAMAKKIRELLDPVVLKSARYTNIKFVGHSMGAAIAMILLLNYAAICPADMRFKSYAVALPRFADSAVTTYFDKNLDFVVINNGNDIITRAHLFPSECAYVTKSIIQLSPKIQSINIAHHFISEYIKNINLLNQNVALLSQVD